MKQLKFKTLAEITDVKNYQLSQYFNLLALVIGTFAVLRGNLILVPFVAVVGLDLILAKQLMTFSTVRAWEFIRVMVIIVTAVITLLF